MVCQANTSALHVVQEGGLNLWRKSAAGLALEIVDSVHQPATLSIGPCISRARCRWHPATLWIGVGCERHTSHALLERAVHQVLEDAGLALEAVAGLSSIEAKGDEPALLHMQAQHNWPLRLQLSLIHI